MDNLKNILKKSGWTSIIESLIFAIIGIVLILKPEGTLNMIAWILGGIFIITGIGKIITIFLQEEKTIYLTTNLYMV